MLVTILVFLLVLSILVFVHEAGHFFVAKHLGIRVEEFGFGLPPRAWGKKFGETLYSLNWLPIGGFVRLAGEDEARIKNLESRIKNKKELHRLFWARGKKERAAVLLAGVTMNFFLAVLILSYIFNQGVFVPTGVAIAGVSPDSPAETAGILVEDTVVSINDVAISSSSQLVHTVQESQGQEIALIVSREMDGEPQEIALTATPRLEFPDDEGSLGISIRELGEIKKYPWYQAPFVGLREAFATTFLMVGALGTIVWRLITFQGLGGVDVGGPVAIAQATGVALQFGVRGVLELMGLLSLNLAIINILPIPALDGGRLLFVVLEKFIGRKVQPRAEAIAHQVGMVFLLGLVLLITVNDILRIVRGV